MSATHTTAGTAAVTAHIFRMHNAWFPHVLEGISEADAARRLHPDVNTVLWIAGHIVDTRMYLSHSLGLAITAPEWYGKFSRRTKPEDAAALPSLAQVLDAFRSTSEAFADAITGVSAEKFSAEAPYQFPESEKTFGSMTEFLAEHEAFHMGQLALLRRFLGLSAMRYK